MISGVIPAIYENGIFGPLEHLEDETIEQVVQAYALSRLTPEAVREAIRLADQALVQEGQRMGRVVDC